MSRTITPDGVKRAAPKHKNSRTVPQSDIDFIFANYGYMNYNQIAISLGYFDKKGLPQKEKVKQIVLKRSTLAQRLEFERRFEAAGGRGKGKKFTSVEVEVAASGDVPCGVLWGNPQTDFWFFPARA